MDFVIVNSEQHSEFDDFKRAMTDRNCVLFSSNALLDYWNDFVRRVSQSTITVYGQKHHYTEMDQLIEWVMKQREKRVSIIIVKILSGQLHGFHIFI